MLTIKIQLRLYLDSRYWGYKVVEWQFPGFPGEQLSFDCEIMVSFCEQTIGGEKTLVMQTVRYRPGFYTCAPNVRIHSTVQNQDLNGYTETYAYLAIGDDVDPEVEQEPETSEMGQPSNDETQ